MASVVLYFHVHQPFRIKPYSVFTAGHDPNYFNANDDANFDLNNEKVLKKVAEKCYLPATNLLINMAKTHPEFKVSFSVTGTVLEQFEQFAPSVLENFKHLAEMGSVEFLAETYYHSLAFLYSKEEFKRQVKKQHQKIKDLFGQEPTAFRNTELIYNNEISMLAEEMGYKVVLAEGVSNILGWRSPNFVYEPVTGKGIKLLLKNYMLSDDIAFRFSNQSWNEWPLSAERFADWVSQINGNGHVVNLFMDFETLGEHQWADTGIFDFLKALPEMIYRHPDNDFKTVTEAAMSYPVMDKVDMHNLTSWADTERDLSAWLSNKMQLSAIENLYALEELVLQSQDADLIEDWRRLQTSDHFYYMCTKWWADGDVHKYFSPYESPYDAFVNYMNVLQDLKIRLDKVSASKNNTSSAKKKKPNKRTHKQ